MSSHASEDIPYNLKKHMKTPATQFFCDAPIDQFLALFEMAPCLQ